jgi:hypothetical protein
VSEDRVATYVHDRHSPEHRVFNGALAAARRLGDAAVDREFLQDQADDPVIGPAGDVLQLREDL